MHLSYELTLTILKKYYPHGSEEYIVKDNIFNEPEIKYNTPNEESKSVVTSDPRFAERLLYNPDMGHVSLVDKCLVTS